MKRLLIATAIAVSLFLPILTSVACAEDASLYSIPLKDIDGHDTSLKAYAGKVLLVVNVASKCNSTPQYTGLEALWRKYQDQGLVVLGFPCNDFRGQEPGTNEEIKAFGIAKFGVSFPMFDKLHVIGPEQHPLYAELSGDKSPFPGPVKWNFGKFLIARDGQIIARFETAVKPESPEVTAAIEKALAEK